MALRISLVQYLNSVPLGWGLTRGPLRNRAEVLLSTPADCADQLRNGRVDAGLIPVAEFQRIEGLEIIPGIAIATQGRARSVLLVSRLPAWQLRTVALDSASRTSAILVQILLSEWFGVRPQFQNSTLELEAMLSCFDGALVIGDRALGSRLEAYYVYDLGEYWVRMTGLPFVFAFWVRRDSSRQPSPASLFAASKEHGLQRLSEISRHYAGILPLSAAEIEEYLVSNIDYNLGPRHQQGLQLFFSLAHRHGLLPQDRPLVFAPD